MKNKLKRTTSMLCALTVAAVPMTMSAFTASANYIHLSDTTVITESDYTLTIPSSFTVANAGWNKIEGGVTASGTLADGKKLVVTAQSDNGWALKSGDNSIGYNLAATGDENSVYNANAEAPTWEFDTLTAEGVSQTAGLIVDNYDEAPAGNYSDNVVFTAGVKDASPVAPAAAARLSDGFLYTYDSYGFPGDEGYVDSLLSLTGDYSEWSKYFVGDGTLKYTLTEDEAKVCAEYLGDKSIVVYYAYYNSNGGCTYKYAKNDNGTISTGESMFVFFDSDEGDWSSFSGYRFYFPKS